MPIYEYKCSRCDKVSEFLENSGRRTRRNCPHCGSRQLERQFSTFAARVKEGASNRCYGCSGRTCPHAGH